MNLTLSILTDEKLFYQFKLDFLLKDPNLRKAYENGLDINHEQDEIELEIYISKSSFQVTDPLTGEVDSEEVFEIDIQKESFDNEFLPLKLSEMIELYKKKLITKTDKDNIYGSEALVNYRDRYVKKLNTIQLKVETSSFLNKFEKGIIFESIDKLRTFLKEKFLDEINLPNKIPLKLPLNQIIGLFYLLHEKGLITGIHVKDLMELVQLFFKYGRAGKYHDINTAQKVYYEYFESFDKDNQRALRLLKKNLKKLIN